jgi:hypothetical protein
MAAVPWDGNMLRWLEEAKTGEKRDEQAEAEASYWAMTWKMVQKWLAEGCVFHGKDRGPGAWMAACHVEASKTCLSRVWKPR